MLLNHKNDFSLIQTSNQEFDPILDESVYDLKTKNLSKKLLNDIKVSISKDTPTKLNTINKIIKVNLDKNNIKPNVVDKIVKDVKKVIGRPHKIDKKSKALSKEISTMVHKKTNSIIEAKKNALKLDGKSSKSASIIANADKQQIKKQIKRELRKEIGKSSIDSKSISRKASEDAKIIEKETKIRMINSGYTDESASMMALAKAKEHKKEIKKLLRKDNGKESKTDSSNKIIIIKNNLEKNGMSPNSASVIVNKITPLVKSIIKNDNQNVKSSKSISRSASREANIIKKITEEQIKNLGTDDITATAIADDIAKSAKKTIKHNMRIAVNKAPKDSRSVSNSINNKYAKTIKIIKKKLIKEGNSPDTVKKIINAKVNQIKQDYIQPIITDRSSRSISKSVSNKVNNIVQNLKNIKNNGSMSKKVVKVKKIMKNIAKMIEIIKLDDHSNIIINPSVSNTGGNSPVNVKNIINIVQKIKPNKIAKKLSSNEILSSKGEIMQKKNRELVLLIVLTSIKNMISQILSINEDLDPNYKNFIMRLISFLNSEEQIMHLISKVVLNNKFMELLNLDNDIETFDNKKVSKKSKKASKKSKKASKKSKKASRKSKKSSNKVSRKSNKASNKASRKSSRKSNKASRKSSRKYKKSSNKSSKKYNKASKRSKSFKSSSKHSIKPDSKKANKLMKLEEFNNSMIEHKKYAKIDTKSKQILSIIQTNLLETFSEEKYNIDYIQDILYYLIIGLIIYFGLKYYKLLN